MRKFKTIRPGFKQRVHLGDLTVGMVQSGHNVRAVIEGLQR